MSAAEPAGITHDPTNDHPSLRELREVAQPASHMARYNSEHWAGALYLRHLSLPVTRWLLPTHISPNGVTILMIGVGVLGAVTLPLPGLIGPILAALMMQLQVLLDCSDGEVARWRQRFSPVGIYLDRIGHYLTEAGLPIALGLRADGYWFGGGAVHRGALSYWTVLGFLVAVVVLMNKAFTDLVIVARAKTGRPMLDDVAATTRSRVSGLAAVRRTLTYLPIFRAFVAIEFSLLTVLAGLFDVIGGGLVGTRVLLVVCVPLSLFVAGGHLLGVLSSARLD